MAEQIVIDAENGTIGRIAAFAAKQALQGNKIAIVNCNDAVISGKEKFTLAEYNKKFARGKRRQVGPYYTRTPSGIMRRTVRGMIPYKQYRGENAFKNIRCYDVVPQEFQSSKKIQIKSIVIQSLSLKRLCELIGK